MQAHRALENGDGRLFLQVLGEEEVAALGLTSDSLNRYLLFVQDKMQGFRPTGPAAPQLSPPGVLVLDRTYQHEDGRQMVISFMVQERERGHVVQHGVFSVLLSLTPTRIKAEQPVPSGVDRQRVYADMISDWREELEATGIPGAWRYDPVGAGSMLTWDQLEAWFLQRYRALGERQPGP
jgi:hypothetical protein